ncbi:ROK family protein [[Mycoplasma] collis]|uniref:ROK family protein n=1 Tax=[Mycoplasma] collis TaxID=2127 RepID=UPI00051C38A9|nr:ROK family protein [[Mycoplasma] collis]
MDYILAFDIGGTNIKYAIIDDNFNIINSYIIKTKTKSLLEQIENIINSVDYKFKTIAIATTGVVDDIKKEIIHAGNNLNYLKGTNFSYLAKKFNKNIVVENDANAAIYAELINNKHQNINNIALITFGTGVGGGILINKKLFKGNNFLGGEVGSLFLTNSNADKELSFSKFNEKIIKKFNFSSKDSEIFLKQYSNNLEFKNYLNKYLNKVAKFLANLSIIYNLEIIKYGGGLSHLDNIFLEKIEKRFYFLLNKTAFKTQIFLADNKNDSGMLGISYLAKM